MATPASKPMYQFKIPHPCMRTQAGNAIWFQAFTRICCRKGEPVRNSLQQTQLRQTISFSGHTKHREQNMVAFRMQFK